MHRPGQVGIPVNRNLIERIGRIVVSLTRHGCVLPAQGRPDWINEVDIVRTPGGGSGKACVLLALFGLSGLGILDRRSRITVFLRGPGRIACAKYRRHFRPLWHALSLLS